MTNFKQQKPGRTDEFPAPQPSETPPLDPDRLSDPGSPETPSPEPEQPAEHPPEYPVPGEDTV